MGWLDIFDPRDALILNIVNVASLEAQEVYINLMSPLVINRNNLVGKQLVLKNKELYSAKQPLLININAM